MKRTLELCGVGLLLLAASGGSLEPSTLDPPIATSSKADGKARVLPDRKCQGVPATGQTDCWDQDGNVVDCTGTGEDGEFQSGWTTGAHPRFTNRGDGTVKDNLTNLIWLKNANCFGELDWSTALSEANNLASGSCGLTDGSMAGDWHLPNVRELQSLIDYGHSEPALPDGHPFSEVRAQLCWSSTSFPGHPPSAWYVSVQYGYTDKDGKFLPYGVWPVRGAVSPVGHVPRGPMAGSRVARVLPDRRCAGVPATGQTQCWDQDGILIDCSGTGQDGEYQNGWTSGTHPRFAERGDGTVKDNLTGLIWLKHASCFFGSWTDALSFAKVLASGSCGLTDGSKAGAWRLPNARELQSLIDYSQDLPALPPGHPFLAIEIQYWSSTSSSSSLLQHSPFMMVYDGTLGVAVGSGSIGAHAWPVRGGD